jgi:hypothetical protein
MHSVLRILEIIWSWPTIGLLVLVLFSSEISTVMERVVSADQANAAVGPVSLSFGTTTETDEDGDKPEEVISEATFGREDVLLDGRTFINCTFNESRLVFRGEAPSRLINNTLIDVNWKLEGPAAATLELLSTLYVQGPELQAAVEQVFDKVRRGPPSDPR